MQTYIGPKLFGYHPTEASEKIGSVQKLGLRFVDEPALAVVVPGRDAPQTRVGPQQGQGCLEVLQEVGGELQIILHDDHLEIGNSWISGQ